MNRTKPDAKNRNGYAMLLMLVVVIAIAACIYYLQFGKPAKSSSGDVMPWKQENLLVKAEQEVEKPTDQQPDISNGLNFDLNVGIGGDDDGGQLGFGITPDGRVFGIWHGIYYDSKKVNYDIMQGNFEGNIAPSKIYKDKDGEDASKLYFIAKGKYLIAANDFKKNMVCHLSGIFYVTGWVNRDNSAIGKITTTAGGTAGYGQTFIWRGWEAKGRKEM